MTGDNITPNSEREVLPVSKGEETSIEMKVVSIDMKYVDRCAIYSLLMILTA